MLIAWMFTICGNSLLSLRANGLERSAFGKARTLFGGEDGHGDVEENFSSTGGGSTYLVSLQHGSEVLPLRDGPSRLDVCMSFVISFPLRK